MQYETILYAEDGPVGTLTLNRPDDANMFTPDMCREVRDCIQRVREETRTRVLVLTGAGDRFFCIGGRKEGLDDTHLYPGVLPTLEMYEAIERLEKYKVPDRWHFAAELPLGRTGKVDRGRLRELIVAGTV